MGPPPLQEHCVAFIAEAAAKPGVPEGDGDWKVKERKGSKMKKKLAPGEWTLVPTEKDTPQQTNGCDCGVFTCMFADYLGAGEALNFSQADMPHFRYRVGARILEGSAEKLVE